MYIQIGLFITYKGKCSIGVVSLCRRWRAGKFWSAAATSQVQKYRSWRQSGAALAEKNFCFKYFRKISFYPHNFLMTFVSVIENCTKISTQEIWHRRRADKLSQSTKVGSSAHKLSAAAARHSRRTALASTSSGSGITGWLYCMSVAFFAGASARPNFLGRPSDDPSTACRDSEEHDYLLLTN